MRFIYTRLNANNFKIWSPSSALVVQKLYIVSLHIRCLHETSKTPPFNVQ